MHQYLLPISSCILIAVLAVACTKKSVPQENPLLPTAVAVVEARSANSVQTQAPVSGIVQTHDQVQLAFQLNGLVESVSVEEGDKVTKGQELARLDLRVYSAQRDQALGGLHRAESALTMLNAGLRPEEIAQAQAQLASTQAVLTQATADYSRARELFTKGVIAKQQLDAAQAGFAQAKEAVRMAEEQLALARQGPRVEQLDEARANVAVAKAQLAQAQTQLEYAVLTAQEAGTVTMRQLEPGQTVAVGVPVFELSNLEELEILAELPERDLMKVSVGSIATVTFPAVPGISVEAAVTSIAPRAQQYTRGFPVQLRLTNKQDGVVPGMVALVQFGYLKPEGQVSIPLRCVVDGAVFVVEDGTAHRIPVEVLDIVGENGFISGISLGDQVVIDGQHYLQDGQAVGIVSALGIGELTSLELRGS